jgi:transcriptional regulator with XRE-family HTH domain
VTQQQLADEFGLSRSYLSRLLRAERRPPLPAPAEARVSAAVENYLAQSTASSPEAEMHAASLRVLAAKLDAVAASDAVGAAQAAPALAR